jgi:hypothetical protein
MVKKKLFCSILTGRNDQKILYEASIDTTCFALWNCQSLSGIPNNTTQTGEALKATLWGYIREVLHE